MPAMDAGTGGGSGATGGGSGATGGGSGATGGGGGATGGGSATDGGVVDTTPPTLLTSTPGTGATNVAATTTVRLEFSEPLAQASLMTTLMPAASLGAPTFNAAGDIVTFTSPTALASSTAYSLMVSATDLAGNALGATTITFTTAVPLDTTPPTVTSTVPASAAANVAVNASIVVNFSEPVNRGSVVATANNGSFDLGIPSFSTDSRVVTFSNFLAADGGAATFAPGVGQSIEIAAADIAGNAMATPYGWAFTTAAPTDTVPPAIATLTPVDSAVAVPRNANVVITFSEPMNRTSVETSFRLTQGAAVAGTFVWSANNTIMSFNPTTTLAASLVHTITFAAPAPTDLAGNALPAFTATFSTGTLSDTVAPTIVATIPAAGRLDYPPYSGCTPARPRLGLRVTFSEDMDRPLVEAAFALLQGANPIAGVFRWNSPQVVDFIPNAPLPYDTTFTVRINNAPNFATDLAQNPLANTTFTFKTLRRLVVALPSDAAQSGRVLSAAPGMGVAQAQVNTTVRAGEFNATVQARGISSIPLSPLPSNLTCIISATMSVPQTSISGAPFGTASLGDVVIEPIDLGALGGLSASDYSSPPADGASAVPVLLSSDPSPGTRQVDVTTKVRFLWPLSTVTHTIRWRSRFTTATSANGTTDAAFFGTSSISAVVEAP